jgi:hypothetical protein
MAKVSATKITVVPHQDGVALHVPISGQQRIIILPAADAIEVSNRLGNAGVDSLNADALDRFPTVEEVKLLPFGHEAGPGHALLRLATSAGPILVRLDAKWLEALADVSAAALEFSKRSGSA